MGLVGAAIAGLLLFHTEDFWFRLNARNARTTSSSSRTKLEATEVVAPLVVENDTEENKEIEKKKTRQVARLTSRLVSAE